jgi:hypothetical protein
VTQRYAYINLSTNETVWGPGPNPYYITLMNGDIWEISAHTVEESEQMGIFIVEEEDKREFDPRFEQQETPSYRLKNGRPVEKYSYSFIPSARDNMISGIDEHAEKIRTNLATQYPGQYEEYVEAYNQALEVAQLPIEQEILPGTYVYLDADVGVTYSETLGRVVENVREASELIIETRTRWKMLGGGIRIKRLETKKNVREAETDAIAYYLYKQFINNN